MLLTSLCTVSVFAADADEVQVGETKMTWAKFVEQYDTHKAASVKLLADVDASALAASLAGFSGTFDGNGKAIKGLTVPLFASLDNATVKNLTIEGNISAEKDIITFAALSVTATGSVLISNCINKANVTLISNQNNTNIAGFVGYAKANFTSLTITSSVNQGNITFSTADVTRNGTCAGFVGRCDAGEVTISKCVNQGDLSITGPESNPSHRVGGIYGANATPVTIVDCVNTGTISSTGMGGGILSEIRANATIENCYNYGAINGGKFADTITSALSTAANRYNHTGGIVGGITKNGTHSIIGCTNYGTVTGTALDGGKDLDNRVGGILGGVAASITPTVNVSACKSFGIVTGSQSSTGGIVGRLASGTTNITACFVNTTVTGSETATAMLYGFKEEAATVVLDTATKYVGTGEGDNVVANEAAYNATLAIKGIACQASSVANGTFSVRFASMLNAVEGYVNAGFEIIRVVQDANGNVVDAGAVDVSVKTVYESLTGTNAAGATVTYTPAELQKDTKYFAAAVVNNVPADVTVTFIVKSYLVNAENSAIITGSVATVTFVNGVLSNS